MRMVTADGRVGKPKGPRAGDDPSSPASLESKV
jgi:hypothetical protein